MREEAPVRFFGGLSPFKLPGYVGRVLDAEVHLAGAWQKEKTHFRQFAATGWDLENKSELSP